MEKFSKFLHGLKEVTKNEKRNQVKELPPSEISEEAQ